MDFQLIRKGSLISGCPERILVVEDDRLSQKVTLLMLRRLGYRADAVSNGVEALKAIERQPFYLVLMNVRMPLMDGMETTRQIRRIWKDKQKIIALTALAYPGAREKCLACGMDDYVSKPVTLDQLAEVLAKYPGAADRPATGLQKTNLMIPH